MKKRVNLYVKGRVQGVWYRAFTKKSADHLSVKGWVQNNLDGSVSVVAEGEEGDLEMFINKCYEGPPASNVEHIDINWSEAVGDFEDFKIIR